MDEYIAVGFTINPNVREIAHHHPGGLPAWDNFFQNPLRTRPDGVLPDGTPLVEAKAHLARVVSYLPPGETTTLEVEVDAGTVLGASPEGLAAFMVPVAGASRTEPQRISVSYGEEARAYAMGEASPGKIVFTAHNPTSERGMLVIAVLPPDFDINAIGLHFLPFLNGKRLLTTQTFRDLFRSEVIQARRGDRRQGDHAALHRPQGLDRAL